MILSCIVTTPTQPLQTIAAYLRFDLGRLDKLQRKVMTHSEKLEWWIILMVDCVTRFCPLLHFSVLMRVQNIKAVAKTRIITIRSQPNSFVAVVVVDIVIKIKHIKY